MNVNNKFRSENVERKSNNEIVTCIIKKLETEAVIMDLWEFSREEYREVFPQGTVKTPIGEVKIGKNQFEKMAEKDNGKRRGLIGAMRQTLADPIVIVQEEKDGKEAYVFIKSFKNTNDFQKPDFVMSVVVTIQDTKVAISTYKRKRREILSKIKKAGVIVYEKDYGTSQTNGNITRH
ncbi:MAG: hypothetical protein LBI28_09070 [Treponema sp.]|jgi:hypothetical protein|nr:hypothetical protein [Treponema sp.]